MKIEKLNKFTRGWIIGNFEPSLLKTKDFEIGIITHKKGEHWPAHYHKLGTEFNVLISGRMTLCDIELSAGDVFTLEPLEIADPVFHEDCVIICVKVPSDTSDKYLL
jgi:quercetin dioxygenase-like cupin family protein